MKHELGNFLWGFISTCPLFLIVRVIPLRGDEASLAALHSDSVPELAGDLLVLLVQALAALRSV